MVPSGSGGGGMRTDQAGTVHDLANVLGVLSASAAMLADDLAALPSDHPARDTAARLLLATDRAGELCERLRAPERPAPSPPHTGRFDLADAVREGVGLLAPALRSVALHLDTATNLPVRGAPLDALQVLLNLVLNAQAASPSGRIHVRATEWVADRRPATVGRLVPGRRYARLLIDDDGPGIGSADPASLFERGATGSRDPARGRGLAVVHAIMERAGGAVVVERSGMGGARFAACWPLAEAGQLDLSGRTLLIVGGGPRAIAGLADAAEASGADVSLCLDPNDAAASIAEDIGTWDGVIVAGRIRDRAAVDIASELRRVDPGLALVAPAPNATPRETLANLRDAMSAPVRRGDVA